MSYDGMTKMDEAWAAFWYVRKAEIDTRDRKHLADRGSAELALENLKSLIRQQSPAAWREITTDARIEPYRRD